VSWGGEQHQYAAIVGGLGEVGLVETVVLALILGDLVDDVALRCSANARPGSRSRATT
jgi:hypothetical protein